MLFLAVLKNSQGNPSFYWRFMETAKKTIFFLAVRQNSQVNPSFAWRLVAKETHVFLGGL